MITAFEAFLILLSYSANNLNCSLTRISIKAH